MKKGLPVVLGAVLLSSAVIASRLPDQASIAAVPMENAFQLAVNDAPAKSTMIAAGTKFDTTLQQQLSTGKNKDGDRFTLKVNTGWFGGDSILKNAQIDGHLEGVVKAARGKKATMRLVFDEIMLKNSDRYPANVALVNTQVQSKTQGKFIQNASVIIGGAVAGKFAGDRTGFKQGALAGGAAAVAYVLSSPGGEVVLKKGDHIKLKFTSEFKPS